MSKLDGKAARELAVAATLDVSKLGFKCGLEIHQQLDTGKLFSPVPSEVVDPDEVAERTLATFHRQLAVTRSELGETDAAAAAESARERRFSYLAIDGITSLVELDEEPPHPMDEDALDVALTYAALLGSRPADEIHVMRKTVVDGSNTSGFQRTSLVATGGSVDAEGGEVGIWTIAVEEDSARKLSEEDGRVTYTLDRLGIPLIEVATAPDIQSPEHAQATAARLGALLRATGRVKRGLGTIRQDLNVSVGVGDRVEIKGCQDLRAVPRVIVNECRRQLWHHFIREELASRGAQPEDIGTPVDATAALAACKSKVVTSTTAKGGKVMAIVLPKFAGLVEGATKDGPRLGREFADHAKVAAGVKGVFHSDELPAYGIEDADVAAIRQALKLTDEAFVLCAAPERQATRALAAVAARARAAMGPAAKEVRAAQPDDTSRFMRPLPGAARMYPETDVPPIRVTSGMIADVASRLPKRPEEWQKELEATGISADLASQLLRDGLQTTYLELLSGGADASLAATTLLRDLSELKHPAAVERRLPEVLAEVGIGFAKEAVPKILAALDGQPDASLADAIAKAGVAAADLSEVDAIIAKVIAERADFVAAKGMAAMGPLMGPIMAELRGKVDGAVLSDRLKAALLAATR